MPPKAKTAMKPVFCFSENTDVVEPYHLEFGAATTKKERATIMQRAFEEIAMKVSQSWTLPSDLKKASILFMITYELDCLCIFQNIEHALKHHAGMQHEDTDVLPFGTTYNLRSLVSDDNRDTIMSMLHEQGIMNKANPLWLSAWQKAVTEVISKLSQEELTQYNARVLEFRKNGPPRDSAQFSKYVKEYPELVCSPFLREGTQEPSINTPSHPRVCGKDAHPQWGQDDGGHVLFECEGQCGTLREVRLWDCLLLRYIH